MKAFILAAGKGTRLFPVTSQRPKTLLPIRKGKRIIDVQLENFLKVAFKPNEIYVIAGHGVGFLMNLKERGVKIIYNNRYDTCNNICSFLMIKDLLEEGEDFVLLNGDTLFHWKILENLLAEKGRTCLVVDKDKELSQEDMKVRVENGRIVEISKEIPLKEAVGEYIGLSLYCHKDAEIIFEKMVSLVNGGKLDLWYEDAINPLLEVLEVRPSYTEGLQWIEVDDFHDLKEARRMGYVL
jgi:choline kinase